MWELFWKEAGTKSWHSWQKSGLAVDRCRQSFWREQILMPVSYTHLDVYKRQSEEEVSALKVSQEEIQTMYEDYCLADKAYEQITGDEAVEISDDEARIIQIQQIFVPEENQAKELKNKLDNGEDFESLAANYSKASQTTITIARGDKDQTYEEVAFNLGNDEISDVFADNNGYYILKCLNTYMESESEANKEKVARQRKTERFHAIYSDLMEDTISEFQQ